MIQNPFYVGGPVSPEKFVGRASEVDTAFDQIFNKGHLAIWGGLRMGKSSLLRFLAEEKAWSARGHHPSEAFIVYLNCTGINPFTPCGFWREVLDLLKDKADGNTALLTAIDEILQQSEIENNDLRRLLRTIGQQNKFLLLLLDDYDAALCANEDEYTEGDVLEFVNRFRTLAVHCEESQYLSTVVTSSRRLSDLGPKLTYNGSPWYNHYMFKSLKPFSDREINSLFCLPITQELREGVREIAAGHPALLQTAGYLLYEKIQRGERLDLQSFARDFQDATQHIFRDMWASSNAEEQMLMMLLALSKLEGRLNKKRRYDLGDIDIFFSQKSLELRNLEQRGIIYCTQEEEKDIYRFSSSIMEWWTIKEIENSDEAALSEREKVLFNLMSRKQAEKINNAIRQVWQYQDAVNSIVSWIARLALTPI